MAQLPEILKKYTRIRDNIVEWDMAKMSEMVLTEITCYKCYTYTNDYVSILYRGYQDFDVDSEYIRAAVEKFEELKIPLKRMACRGFCWFDSKTPSHSIGKFNMCDACYNAVMEIHQKLVKVATLHPNFKIYKLENYENSGCIYNGAINRRGISTIFKTQVESINLYHPKFLNLHPLWCYICDDYTGDNGKNNKCPCNTLVPQIFASRYYFKANLIKHIESLQDILIPKDIVSVISKYFIEVCKNYNYTDNILLQVDEDRLPPVLEKVG